MSTTESAESIQPTQIPTPPDFPVTWPHPGDERIFWTTDRMHFPDPLKPLDDAFIGVMYGDGLGHAAEQYDLPIRMHPRRINTYHYTAILPLPLSQEELEATGKRAQERLGTAMATLMADWSDRYLPEIRQLIAESEAVDLDGATTPQLLDHFEDELRRLTRQWEIHFLLVFPIHLARSLHEDFYRDVFGEQDALNAYRLLQGLDNLTVQMGRDLWKLSRAANPVVRGVIKARPAQDVINALERTPGGDEFLAQLSDFVERYGRRGSAIGPSNRAWIEDPTPVIRMLKDYLTLPDQDPDVELARLAAKREQAVAAARARLQDYPRAVAEQFEALLKMAQDATIIGEDHAYWIDFRATYEIRRVVLELGRRFAAAGVIAEPEDVFYLGFDEVRETARQLPRLDRRPLIAAHKAEMAHFGAMVPPPAIGTPPPGPPPEDPLFRAFGKFFGAPPRPSDEPDLLNGGPGSAGTVTGPVKVVRSLAEADKLQPGDILVAETTTQTWTPLFAAVAAVVTDTGGILSHCAVVAREYGIPCVVGAGIATSVLKDGQIVEVDGTAGTVRVVGRG